MIGSRDDHQSDEAAAEPSMMGGYSPISMEDRPCDARPLMITSLPAIASAQEPPDSPEVDTALRAVVQKYVVAREARDPKAIEPLFTADAGQLVSDGTSLWGGPGNSDESRAVSAVPRAKEQVSPAPQ